MTNRPVLASALCVVILIAGPTASNAAQRDPAPDYPQVFGDLYSRLCDTGDFGLVKRNAATIRRYFCDVVKNIFAGDNDSERTEDLCRYYLFLHSRSQMGPDEWRLLRRMHQNGSSGPLPYPVLYLEANSPLYDSRVAAETERLRRIRWSDALLGANARDDPDALVRTRRQVEKWDFIPSMTAEYVLSDRESCRDDIAEDMFVFIIASGWSLTWRCRFAVLEYWQYLPRLRRLAKSWLEMTADRGGTDYSLLQFLELYGLGLGESFGDVLSIYKTWPPTFRNHRLLMMTALASGDPESIREAVAQLKAAPRIPRSEAEWAAFFSGVPIEDCGFGPATEFGGFGPFLSQEQCAELGDYLVQRLNAYVDCVPLAEGIESYCELKHKRSRDEAQVMEMVRARLPEPFRREVIRGMILKRVPANAARLMTLYPVVDFRDGVPSGPLEILRMTDLRERMKSGRPDEPEPFETTRYRVFMMLRVLFLLMIKAEEG